LTLFKEDGKTEPARTADSYHFQSKRFNFVKKHYKVLPKAMREAHDWDTLLYLEDSVLRDMVYEINAYELAHNREANIWDLKFYTTTATEDNDTEEE
jgi:hypothetical protein